MKMRKKFVVIISLLTLCTAVIIPLSCSKHFLNQTDTMQSDINASTTKSSDVVSLVNAIYDTYQNSNLLKKSIWYWANFETHDFFNWGGDIIWNNYQIPANFSPLTDFWNNSYIGIARANAV